MEKVGPSFFHTLEAVLLPPSTIICAPCKTDVERRVATSSVPPLSSGEATQETSLAQEPAAANEATHRETGSGP